MADGWLGLAISPKGDTVYVGGGSKASLFEFAFANGVLTPARTFVVVPQAQRGTQDFVGDVAFSPDGRLLYAANLYRDSISVVNPQSGMVIGQIKTGRRPYRILFHPDGKSFFVTHWADGTMGQYDTAGGSIMGQPVRVGAHASDMVWRNGAPGDRGGGSAALHCAHFRRRRQHQSRVRARRDRRQGSQHGGEHQHRHDAAPADGDDPFRPGSERRWQTPLRGVLGCQRCRRGGCRRLAQPRGRLHSHRLVSHRGARPGQRNAGGPERQGASLLPQRRERSQPLQTSQPGACRRTRAARRTVRGTHADRHGVVDRTLHRGATQPLDRTNPGQLALPRPEAG